VAINGGGKILLLNKNERSFKISVVANSPESEIAKKITKFIFFNYI
jgi:hypothetical protein